MDERTEQNSTSLVPFDYSTLEAPKRLHIQVKAEAIRMRIKRTADDIIAIGQDLAEVKQELGHGLFLKWLKTEFDMSESAATKFMQVAHRFGDKSVKITNLSATVLYFLAAPSTPDEIVARVLSGEIPADAKAIKEAKEAQLKTEEQLRQECEKRSIVETALLNRDYEKQGRQKKSVTNSKDTLSSDKKPIFVKTCN